MPRSMVEVKFSVLGLHYWPDAPEDLSFLRDKHNHRFVFRARFVVTDLDRQIEFFTVQELMRQWLLRNYESTSIFFDFGSNSCEMLATKMLNDLDATWVGVWEDDENGSIAEL